MSGASPASKSGGPSVSSGDRKNGVPTTVTSIPLVDPHAPKPDPSIGDLVKDATAQVSTLVRAEVELAQRRDHPRRQEGPHRQRLLHLRARGAVLLDVLFLLLRRRAPRHLAVAVGRVPDRVRHHGATSRPYSRCSAISRCGASGVPQQTIETVKEIPDALTPGHDKTKALSASDGKAGQPDRGSVRLVMAPQNGRSVGGPHRRSMAPSARCTPTAFGFTWWKPRPKADETAEPVPTGRW